VATRRRFLETGLQAVLAGLVGRSALARVAVRGGIPPAPPGLARSRPFLNVPRSPQSVTVSGLPFARGFSGDTWNFDRIPFHHSELNFPGGRPPEPTETVEVAIVGGGLSGLATAYMLRHRQPVLFELRPMFGGVSAGETWAGIPYSLGGAYFITPDEGSYLEGLYAELGLDEVYRLSPGGDDPAELDGVILDDFWSGAGLAPDEVLAFERYAEIVRDYAENTYPDIPLDEKQDNQWILDLDWRTLREDIELRMGMPVPPLLAAGVQSYCYSSFGAGWDEISAASGWNFVAAEEYGRWVCPGGNAWVCDVLWRKLVRSYEHSGTPGALKRLRSDSRAVDVRFAPGGLLQVTYKEASGAFRSLLARRVVMACSKHVAKYLLREALPHDPAKENALNSVYTSAYVVANVLLDAPLGRDFYDVFLLGDGNFPMHPGQAEQRSRVVDMLNGGFTQPSDSGPSVLTLYWPLPWPSARFTLIDLEPAWRDYAERLAPQIDAMLSMLGIPRRSVRQVRMTRWGHSMPIAYPGFIASGVADEVRRPMEPGIYFVNQDNWSLPAFETCLLEANTWSAEIDASL
jgi:hypothetical protein